ncbi:STAS domain-containing protein [Streptomyces rubiginosohelvolus]|uniref:STAS domain-containing protein n=1 Tax=Streptomyces rubiginosohelvolus TaxID=67362 RepID=UPI0033D62EC3|nr:STAS domain-containing protein [Streptomyces rubiginosohelvolus]
MPWQSQAHVRVCEEHHALVVAACGDFDADERDLLLAAWDEADERGLPATVVDLTGVTFADSSLLDALLRARARHHTAGRRLVLAGPLPSQVLLLLTVTGALEHFLVAGSLVEALQSPPDGETAEV